MTSAARYIDWLLGESSPTEQTTAMERFFNQNSSRFAQIAQQWRASDQQDASVYLPELKKLAKPFGIKAIKMTNSPFGCLLDFNGVRFHLKAPAVGGVKCIKKSIS